MVLVLCLVGVAVLLALAGLFAFGLRRRLLQRSGGTFDCNLRWNAPARPSAYADDDPAEEEPPAVDGKGWAYGVARYNGDQIEWFRVFSYAPRPRRFLERNRIEVLQRRDPEGEEELALLSNSVILACSLHGTRVELAMSEDALTGFLAWLEAAPPGQRVNVA
ncbi:DUF2550 domain-containing protein [Streptomyces sp. WMMB 322]|uniref:DUF2550 domain-containing protein n=1 Tax=Streptomyces sp. WMMB 322 TaxID=1286821 RepID=UPI0006E33183|nr:DUF2550 domain-containing protein [Streptomyces sp. WMMB 322]